LAIYIALDRAGFEPRRAVGFVPDIPDRESAGNLNRSSSEMALDRALSSTMGCCTERLKSGADTNN
jgi:hypothetical protein